MAHGSCWCDKYCRTMSSLTTKIQSTIEISNSTGISRVQELIDRVKIQSIKMIGQKYRISSISVTNTVLPIPHILYGPGTPMVNNIPSTVPGVLWINTLDSTFWGVINNHWTQFV